MLTLIAVLAASSIGMDAPSRTAAELMAEVQSLQKDIVIDESAEADMLGETENVEHSPEEWHELTAALEASQHELDALLEKLESQPCECPRQ